jgi:hypothetical protein
MKDHSVLWRRLDTPGHEACRVSLQGFHWRLSGTAVFAHEREPCRLDYAVTCDSEWRTLSGSVAGWVGQRAVDVEISVDDGGRWRLDGAECPAVDGCTDLDLNFSPSTNLLPIRRLGLEVGAEELVRAAWLRFPSFTLEPFEQVYRRTGELAYRYGTPSGFSADLRVNAAGLVLDYANVWVAEEGA